MALKSYQVTGSYEGKEIDNNVEAYSEKQAKLKSGFKNGYGGSNLGKYIKSNKLRVEEY